jgi:hypothetical protein
MSPKGLVCAFYCRASAENFLLIQEALERIGAKKVGLRNTPFGTTCKLTYGTAEIVLVFESEDSPIIMYAESKADDQVVEALAKALERM